MISICDLPPSLQILHLSDNYGCSPSLIASLENLHTLSLWYREENNQLLTYLPPQVKHFATVIISQIAVPYLSFLLTLELKMQFCKIVISSLPLLETLVLQGWDWNCRVVVEQVPSLRVLSTVNQRLVLEEGISSKPVTLSRDWVELNGAKYTLELDASSVRNHSLN